MNNRGLRVVESFYKRFVVTTAHSLFLPQFKYMNFDKQFRQRLSNWKAPKRRRQYRKAWWVVVVHCCIVKFTSFQRDGRQCYEYLFACVKRNKMDSVLLTCLLNFIEYFPDYLSALSRTLLRFFWTTFVETAVFTIISSPKRVYIELTGWSAPGWLDSSIGRALHRYRRGHGFESRSSLNYFFSGLIFATA